MDKDGAAEFSNIEYVFLDRDGVLNRNPSGGRFVTCWEEFQLLPGVEEAIAALNQSGRKAIVITNQRGIALGLFSHDDLNRLHHRLGQQIAIKGAHLDAIYVCPHDIGQCNCRKPLTGLFEKAFADFPRSNPGNSVMVGDSGCDIEASHKLGMRSVLITGGSKPITLESQQARKMAHASARSLAEFVSRCLGIKVEGEPETAVPSPAKRGC